MANKPEIIKYKKEKRQKRKKRMVEKKRKREKNKTTTLSGNKEEARNVSEQRDKGWSFILEIRTGNFSKSVTLWTPLQT